jgi:hypothetical protein
MSHYVHILKTFKTMQETFKMELTGLTSDSEYEVRLRAMNSQGWSQLSNPFQFRTAGTATARAGASSPTLSSSEQQVQQ